VTALSTPADVGAVIVNYRSAADVVACLESLAPLIDQGLRVVVVDNDSDDGSLERLAAWRDRVSLVAAARNGGFSAGCNIGADALSTENPPTYLWFLNPDCEIELGALDGLLAAAAAEPSVGLWGSLLVDRDAPEVVQCAGGFTYTPCLTRSQPVGASLPRRDVAATRRVAIDFVSGAAMFFRRDAFVAVGGFSPDYFLYCEEIDVARRLAVAGWRIDAALDSVVRHAGASTTGGKSAGRRTSSTISEFHSTRSTMIFTWRFHRWCLPIAVPARLAFKTVQLTAARQPRLILSMLAGYGAFLRWVVRRK